MLKKSKVKSTTGISEDRRRKSAASANLRISPSFIRKFQKFARKQKSHFSKNTDESGSKEVSKEARLASNVPKDAAVHFGNFYGVQDSANKLQPGKTKSYSMSSALSLGRPGPRSEFTRQMVHKLERTAGTEEYARQVSALLEETVEPAHFKLYSLPTENSIPDGRQNPSGYPLWYKEPYKMPFTSDEIYKLLKQRFDDISKKGKDVFPDEEVSESCEELSDEWKAEENEDSPDNDASNLEKTEESLFNALSSASTSATEAKDTDSKDSDDDSSANKDTKQRR